MHVVHSACLSGRSCVDRSPGCSLLPCVVDTYQVAVTVLCSHCGPQAGRRSETLVSVLRQAGRRSETLVSVLRHAGRTL